MTDSALPDGVALDESGGSARLRIATPAVAGEISLNGATVTSWRPTGQSGDVLFVSPYTSFSPGKAIRGGIPLCGPWFGPGRNGDRTPAHGFLRTSPWRVADVTRDEDDVRVILRLTSGEYAAAPGGAAYDQDAVFTLSVTMGSTLTVVLAVQAGERALDVEWALHTYLRVGDVRDVRLDGLDGAGYVDKVAGGVRKRQEGPVVLVGETDRVYARATPVSVHDPGLSRTVLATGVGNAQTVVWNPFGDKAAGMADLGDAWPHFVCVESARVLDDHLTVAPGTRAEIGQRLSAE